MAVVGNVWVEGADDFDDWGLRLEIEKMKKENELK